MRPLTIALLGFWGAGTLAGQPQVFDVASIKPSAPIDATPIVRIGPQPGGRWIATEATVWSVLRALYPELSPRNHDYGGPDWTRRLRFDISAVASGNPTREELNEMARQLLRDRFALRVRMEERDVRVYAMVVASRDKTLGRNITPAAFDCDPFFLAGQRGEPRPSIPPRPPGGSPVCGMATDGGVLEPVMRAHGGGLTMAQIADFMSGFRLPEPWPIVDRTGLEGRYGVDVRFTVYNGLSVDGAPTGVPLLPGAMADQLGLRLEPATDRRQVLLIDQISMPSPD